MFAEWIPIAKMTKFETFKDTPETTQVVVGNVFIGIALMVLAAIFTFMFYWAYQKDKHLFITILCAVVFLYTIKVIILVASLRDKVNLTVFRLYVGSTAFMSIMALIMMVYFAIKTSSRLNSSSSSSSSSYNIPAAPMDQYNAGI